MNYNSLNDEKLSKFYSILRFGQNLANDPNVGGPETQAKRQIQTLLRRRLGVSTDELESRIERNFSNVFGTERVRGILKRYCMNPDGPERSGALRVLTGNRYGFTEDEVRELCRVLRYLMSENAARERNAQAERNRQNRERRNREAQNARQREESRRRREAQQRQAERQAERARERAAEAERQAEEQAERNRREQQRRSAEEAQRRANNQRREQAARNQAERNARERANNNAQAARNQAERNAAAERERQASANEVRRNEERRRSNSNRRRRNESSRERANRRNANNIQTRLTRLNEERKQRTQNNNLRNRVKREEARARTTMSTRLNNENKANRLRRNQNTTLMFPNTSPAPRHFRRTNLGNTNNIRMPIGSKVVYTTIDGFRIPGKVIKKSGDDITVQMTSGKIVETNSSRVRKQSGIRNIKNPSLPLKSPIPLTENRIKSVLNAHGYDLAMKNTVLANFRKNKAKFKLNDNIIFKNTEGLRVPGKIRNVKIVNGVPEYSIRVSNGGVINVSGDFKLKKLKTGPLTKIRTLLGKPSNTNTRMSRKIRKGTVPEGVMINRLRNFGLNTIKGVNAIKKQTTKAISKFNVGESVYYKVDGVFIPAIIKDIKSTNGTTKYQLKTTLGKNISGAFNYEVSKRNPSNINPKINKNLKMSEGMLKAIFSKFNYETKDISDILFKFRNKHSDLKVSDDVIYTSAGISYPAIVIDVRIDKNQPTYTVKLDSGRTIFGVVRGFIKKVKRADKLNVPKVHNDVTMTENSIEAALSHMNYNARKRNAVLKQYREVRSKYKIGDSIFYKTRSLINVPGTIIGVRIVDGDSVYSIRLTSNHIINNVYGISIIERHCKTKMPTINKSVNYTENLISRELQRFNYNNSSVSLLLNKMRNNKAKFTKNSHIFLRTPSGISIPGKIIGITIVNGEALYDIEIKKSNVVVRQQFDDSIECVGTRSKDEPSLPRDLTNITEAIIIEVLNNYNLDVERLLSEFRTKKSKFKVGEKVFFDDNFGIYIPAIVREQVVVNDTAVYKITIEQGSGNVLENVSELNLKKLNLGTNHKIQIYDTDNLFDRRIIEYLMRFGYRSQQLLRTILNDFHKKFTKYSVGDKVSWKSNLNIIYPGIIFNIEVPVSRNPIFSVKLEGEEIGTGNSRSQFIVDNVSSTVIKKEFITSPRLAPGFVFRVRDREEISDEMTTYGFVRFVERIERELVKRNVTTTLRVGAT